MTYALVIDFLPGTTLETAHSRADDLCTRLCIPFVKFNFNGAELLVSQGMPFKELEKNYHRQLESLRKDLYEE